MNYFLLLSIGFFSIIFGAAHNISNKTLKFNSNNTFTILHLTDLHYGENYLDDLNSNNVTSYFINTVNPDVIIITGDIVSGYAYDSTPNFFYNCWTNFTHPIQSHNKLYALTLGNHDDSADYNRDQIATLDMSNYYSLFNKSTGIHGVSNYYLPINSARKNNISSILWLFDSGNTGCSQEVLGYGCIEEDQIKWYNKTTYELKQIYGNKTHNIAFMHIPPYEVLHLYNEGEFYGDYNEGISCPIINSGFINTIINNKDINGVYFGHDHLNSIGGWYNGVELVCTKKSGFGGYGTGVRSARVIKLQEIVDQITGEVVDVKRDHYLIFDDGSEDHNKASRKRGNKPYQYICSGTEKDSIVLLFGQTTFCLFLLVIWSKIFEKLLKFIRVYYSKNITILNKGIYEII